MKHGTPSGYTYHGCRCDDCRAAFRAVRQRWLDRVKGTEPPEHGANGYTSYACRCDVCREAIVKVVLRHRAHRKAGIGPVSDA